MAMEKGHVGVSSSAASPAAASCPLEVDLNTWFWESEHLVLRAGSQQGPQLSDHLGWSLEFLILHQLIQSSESTEVKGGIYMENNYCTAWDNQD